MATLKQAFDRLHKFASRYPEVTVDRPWGEYAVKVKGKTFVFMGVDKERLGLSLKLPRSREFALEMHAFTKPTPYGLGKSGWITAEFGAKDKPPLDILEAWIDESYRAVAPKRLVTRLESGKATLPASKVLPASKALPTPKVRSGRSISFRELTQR